MSDELKPPRRGIRMESLPEGGGVRLKSYDLDTGEKKTSITYLHRVAAIEAMRDNAVEWETK